MATDWHKGIELEQMVELHVHLLLFIPIRRMVNFVRHHLMSFSDLFFTKNRNIGRITGALGQKLWFLSRQAKMDIVIFLDLRVDSSPCQLQLS